MVRPLYLNIVMLSLIVFGIYVQHDGSSMKILDLVLKRNIGSFAAKIDYR